MQIKKRLFIFLFLIVTISCTNVYGFILPSNYSLLYDSTPADSGAFYFNIDNTNFVWDNEYFNNIAVGYTLIGYYITPKVRYHFSTKLTASAGVNLIKYSGVDSYSTVIPTYSVTYKNNNSTLIFGTLQGTIKHRLTEPLYFNELYFTKNIENGLQYIYNNKRFWLDTWLDWQTFIFPGDKKQEELIAGINGITKVITSEKLNINLLTTFLTSHHGGQIDSTDLNIQTLLNYGVGIDISKPLKNSYPDKISLLSQYIGFSDISPTMQSLYSNGNGIMNNIRVSKNKSYIQIGYYSADKFLSITGNPMYQCQSTVDSTKNMTNRHLITGNIFLSKKIFTGGYLSFMTDVYYDIDNKQTDYSLGLTLTINHDFFIGRIK